MAYETLGMREKAKRQGVDGGSCHDRPTGPTNVGAYVSERTQVRCENKGNIEQELETYWRKKKTTKCPRNLRKMRQNSAKYFVLGAYIVCFLSHRALILTEHGFERPLRSFGISFVK